MQSLRFFIFLGFLTLAACGGSGNLPEQNDEPVANLPPVANDDSFSIDSDAVLPVLANDNDPEGEALTITSLTQPENGSVSIQDGLSIQLSIDIDFVGSDSFTYTVIDASGASSTARVRLDIDPAAKRPVAVNDRVTGFQDTVLIIDVLANDSDGNGDVLTIESLTAANNASVDIDNNQIRYVPSPDFLGEDSFTYTVSDGGLSATAQVNVLLSETSNGVNQAPTASDDQVRVLFESVAVFDVLKNDFDPEGDNLSISNVLGADHGVAQIVNLSSNGRIVEGIQYTPDANFTGKDSLIYILSDGNQEVAGVVNIDVSTAANNSAPLAIDDYAYTPPDTGIRLSPFANDSDPENDTLSLVSIEGTTNGQFTVNDNATPADISDDVLIYTPNTGFSGNELIVYTLSDGIAEDRGAINIQVASSPIATTTVAGSIYKGAVRNSLISLFPVDANGQALSNATVVAATSEVDGSWQVQIPVTEEFLLASASGGSFVDEADPDVNAETKRVIELSDLIILESIWQEQQSQISITPYTSATVRKSRFESRGNFAQAFRQNAEFQTQTFEFDIFSLQPVEPLQPNVPGTDIDQRRYALALGGFANVMNAHAFDNGLAVPSTALIDAAIDDLSDCRIDGRAFGQVIDFDIRGGSEMLSDITDLNLEIRRFRNNNFNLYGTFDFLLDQEACEQVAVITDNVAPEITLNGNAVISIEVFGTYTELGASATDNIDQSVTVSNDSAAVVNTSVLGTYIVTYTASDASGNTSTAQRTVNVVDTTPPVISLFGNAVEAIQAGSAYIDAGATVSDAGDANVIVTNDAASSVNSSVVGSYTVTFTATDASGNTANETRTVNVVDTTPPVITLLGTNPQVIEAGTSYVELNASAADNLDGDITAAIIIDATAVNTSVVGSYSVTYDVVDASGNAALQVTRTVNVLDTTLPIITLLGANPQVIEAGTPYVELNASAADNLDGDITADIIIDATAVDTSVIGIYPVTYDVVDASGNAAVQLTRNVDVLDSTPPDISLNGPTAIYILNTVDLSSVDQGVTVTDIFAVTVASNILSLDTSTVTAPGAPLILTYTATDANGLSSTINREVHVVDDEDDADSDSDLVSDAIENAFGSNPVVRNSLVQVFDVNASGDGSGSDWQNARTDFSTPVQGSATTDQPAYVLMTANSFATSFSGITECNNLIILGSLVLQPDLNKPASRLAAGNLPNSGLQLDIAIQQTALNLVDCDNIQIADFRISGGTGDPVSRNGGGINAVGGTTLDLQNVWLTENSARQFGSGINIEGTDTLVTISDSLVSNNMIDENSALLKSGGGIRIGDEAIARISNTEVTGNTLTSSNPNAPLVGAGISISDVGTEVEIVDTLIAGNTILANSDFASRGAGLALRNNADADLNSVRILNNTASSMNPANDVSGGGIFIESASLSMDSSTISGNRSDGSGGGIDENNSATIQINNSIFSGNTATGAGGAISINNASLAPISIVNNLFVANKGIVGGAISQTESSGVRISNNTIAHNESVLQGAAFFTNNSVINYFNNISRDNKSGIAGTEDYFFVGGTTATTCSNNYFANDPMNPLCVNSFASVISPIAARGYYLRSNNPGVFINPARDSGVGTLASAEVEGLTTRPATGAADEGVPDLGYHYPAGLGSDFGANFTTANTSSVLLSPTAANDDNAEIKIRPVLRNGTDTVAGQSVYFRIDALPDDTSLISPMSTAEHGQIAGFSAMQDNGDGTYSIRLNIGSDNDDIIISVLTNPMPSVDRPEQFTFSID